MNFLSLIGKQPKDDDVIEVLDDFDMTVEYDFDRSHENMPDKYWGCSKQRGLQFTFDENQVLQTIFIYRSGIEGYTPFSGQDGGISFFATIKEAEKWMHDAALAPQKGEPKEFQGIWREWIRAEKDGKFISYEFRRDGPSMITLYQKK
jgi:hypothetical protein